MNNLAGQTVKGYDLRERIGAGGFGAVYRAVQSTVGREVAVKIILPGLANQPDFIRRFESEAHVIARLEHPYIVPLYDYWRDPDGAYLVMRWLRGGSLHETLKSQGNYTVEETVAMMAQITQALHTAHRNQVIHRDIKPANILLDDDGNAYLADFGIAKDHTISQGVTDADAIVGSPDYLAPEQARSEPITPQTDIYSLGVVLYEMLEGEHPFPEISPIEQLFKHLNEALPEIQSLDDNIRDDVNDVIQKATAKNPQERFKNVMELSQALRNAAQLDGRSVTASLVELLTPREQEVLQHMIAGKTNREIAEALVVEVSTVKWYNKQIYRKLNVRSRVQAIVKARELELVLGKPTAQTIVTNNLPEPENPYKGLRAFQAADAQDFFGREKLTQKLMNRLQEDVLFKRFLAIVGPSGSGKSSVVRAGLIPALWRGDLPDSDKWYIVDMLPGDRPLDELEVALLRVAGDNGLNIRDQLERDSHGLIRAANLILPDDGSELVIVIDQFEEVFTLLENEDDRLHFLHLLREAVTKERSRIRVVVTLRADYYDRPLQYPEFGELLQNRVETVLPLGASELERAIRDPAITEGVQFEDGLVSRIVADVNYQPGALPLLQYALTELFERRAGRTLTQKAYAELGGTGGALAKRADELYLERDEVGREQVHQLFLRLVTLGEGAEDTRRRVLRAELLDIASESDVMDDIIDTYAESRLLSLDYDPATRRPTVEVAHEAILREWDRLRQWLNDSRDDIRQQRIVAQAATDWKAHNQDKSYLLRGARLEQAETWQQASELNLTPLEIDYIAASIEQRGHETEVEETRIADKEAQQQRSRTLLRGLVAVFALATLVSIGFGMFALNRQNVATVALDDAEQSADEFRSIALTFGAQDALDNGQPDVALALAQEAVSMDNPPFASEQMFFTTSSSSWMKQRFLVSDTRVWDAVYHPDGERIITTSWDGRTIVWDIETGEELQSLQREGHPLHVTVHPDGNLLAVGGRNGHLQLWNLETNVVTDFVIGNASSHMAPIFTRDGLLMLTSTHDGTINIWDLETLEITRSFEAHDARIQAIHFNADESLLITSSLDSFVKIWDFKTGELLQSFDLNDITNGRGAAWNAHFLPESARVLVAGDTEFFLWDWQSDEMIWLINDFGGTQDIALSPNRQTFVVGLRNGEAQLRDVETGKLIRVYQGHSQRIQNVDYSPDGRTVLTGSNDGTAAIWPVNWEGALLTHSVTGAADDLVVHPTRPLVAIVSTEVPYTTIYLVNTDTGEVIQELMASQGIMTLAFSPDGRYLLSGHADSDDPNAYIWDIETGEQVFGLDEDYSVILDITVSQDGQIAALGEGEGFHIFLWDIATGESRILGNQTDFVEALVFSPDGQQLYSGGFDGSLLQWDVQTGEIVTQFAGHPITIRDIDASNDGTRLVSGSHDLTAIVWDTNTGDALFTLQGHTDFIKDVEFSPDDSTILTSSLDGTIILWDAQTGERLRTYVATDDPINLHAHFSPDGQTIISGANDILTIWDASPLPVDLETWVTENRYIPDFTCEQRALYQIEPLCEE